MIIRKSIFAGLSAACITLAAPAAMAAPSQEVVDALVAELVEQGFNGEIRIRPSGDRIEVEASGPSGYTERVYSEDGGLLFEEETEMADGSRVEREYDSAGQLVSEEYEASDEVEELREIEEDEAEERRERAEEEEEERRERAEEEEEERLEREEEEEEERREREEEANDD